MFALVVVSKCNDPTYKGNEFLVVNEPEGWVPATSIFYQGVISTDAKIFPSVDEAEYFAKTWEGHPWWCQPYKNKYKIIEVKPKYRQVLSGYEIEGN